jgi:hypothetical protein
MGISELHAVRVPVIIVSALALAAIVASMVFLNPFLTNLIGLFNSSTVLAVIIVAIIVIASRKIHIMLSA